MYMANYKCHVSGTSSTRQLAQAKAPVYCQDDQSKCVGGAKQMIAWNRTSRPRQGFANKCRKGRKQCTSAQRGVAGL